MSEADDHGWTRRRWVTTGALLVGLHFAALFAVEKRAGTDTPLVAPPRIDHGPEYVFLAEPLSNEDVAKSILAMDPAALAVPNIYGFSGVAWLRPEMANYEAAESSEPLRWLTMDSSRLGERFLRYAQTNVAAGGEMTEKPAPVAPLFLVPRGEAMNTQTVIHVEGELASRALRQQLTAPPMASPELLRDTVLEVGVDDAGMVASARIVQRSGMAAADAQALKLATQMRFAAQGTGRNDQEPLQWGRVQFQWHTVEPPKGN